MARSDNKLSDIMTDCDALPLDVIDTLVAAGAAELHTVLRVKDADKFADLLPKLLEESKLREQILDAQRRLQLEKKNPCSRTTAKKRSIGEVLRRRSPKAEPSARSPARRIVPLRPVAKTRLLATAKPRPIGARSVPSGRVGLAKHLKDKGMRPIGARSVPSGCVGPAKHLKDKGTKGRG